MDPLSALRDFTFRNELHRITRVDGGFRFGNEYTFPCSAQTSYRSKQGTFFTIETLVYFIQNINIKHTDYLQAARSLSIPSVTYIDRKSLHDYLTGKLSSSDSVVFPLPQHHHQQNPNHGPSILAENIRDINQDGNHLCTDLAGAATYDGAIAVENAGYNRFSDVSMILSVERPLKDRKAMLQCKNRDFHSVFETATRREEERQRIESQDGLVVKTRLDGGHESQDGLVVKTRLDGGHESQDGLVVKTRLDGGHDVMRGRGGYDSVMENPKLHLKGGKVGEGVPIILVPSAFQTLITIHNVKDFLEDGVFIPTDVKVKNINGQKPECVTVQKKFSTDRNRVMAAYEVRDKPSALKADDWDRVVAVFVLRKEWQFKDWPFKNRSEIFRKIIGFYARFEDDRVELAETIKQWNVKIISISKHKRHQDKAAALEVWDRIEEFVQTRSHS